MLFTHWRNYKQTLWKHETFQVCDFHIPLNSHGQVRIGKHTASKVWISNAWLNQERLLDIKPLSCSSYSQALPPLNYWLKYTRALRLSKYFHRISGLGNPTNSGIGHFRLRNFSLLVNEYANEANTRVLWKQKYIKHAVYFLRLYQSFPSWNFAVWRKVSIWYHQLKTTVSSSMRIWYLENHVSWTFITIVFEQERPPLALFCAFEKKLHLTQFKLTLKLCLLWTSSDWEKMVNTIILFSIVQY